jgi:hypothetical protein
MPSDDDYSAFFRLEKNEKIVHAIKPLPQLRLLVFLRFFIAIIVATVLGILALAGLG